MHRNRGAYRNKAPTYAFRALKSPVFQGFSRAGGFWPCSAFDAWSCARMEGFSFSLRAASCKALGFSPERGWMHLIRSVTRIVVSFSCRCHASALGDQRKPLLFSSSRTVASGFPLKVDLQAVGLPVDLHGAALKLPAYIGRLLVPGQFLNPAL